MSKSLDIFKLWVEDLNVYAKKIQLDPTLTKVQRINYLADKMKEAIDNKDEYNYNLYFGALASNFTYRRPEIDRKIYTLKLGEEGPIDVITKGIIRAFDYCAWQDPNKHISAQQAINQCISTEILNLFYFSNLDKNSANYNTASFSTPLKSNKDSADNKVQTLEDKLAASSPKIKSLGKVEAIIREYIMKDKLLTALVIDNIAFADSEKVTKEVNKTEDGKSVQMYREFSLTRLKKNIVELDDNYSEYFTTKYDVAKEKITKLINEIKETTGNKLRSQISNCLLDLKANITLDDLSN